MQLLKRDSMKKGIIILWLVLCVPLLCLAAQWSRSLSAHEPAIEVVPHLEQPHAQSPLGAEREYTTNGMWCILHAIASSNPLVKWQESSAGHATSHLTHTPLFVTLGCTSSHLPFPDNGCSVIIRLHHLII